MGREVVEVVESMLSRTQEVLCFLVLQRACVDGDAEWKDWPASLALLALYVRAQISSERPAYSSIRPIHHGIQGKFRPVYSCGPPPYWQANEDCNGPE